MTALARIKVKGVKAAIAANGGIDGAAATVERGRSVVGDWNNRSHEALPSLGCAFALDEVALATSGKAPILQALATELGFVAIRLPEGLVGEDAETGALAAAMAEFGDVARALTEGRADGVLSPREREGVAAQIDEAIASLMTMKAIVLPGAVQRVPVRVRP